MASIISYNVVHFDYCVFIQFRNFHYQYSIACIVLFRRLKGYYLRKRENCFIRDLTKKPKNRAWWSLLSSCRAFLSCETPWGFDIQVMVNLTLHCSKNSSGWTVEYRGNLLSSQLSYWRSICLKLMPFTAAPGKRQGQIFHCFLHSAPRFDCFSVFWNPGSEPHLAPIQFSLPPGGQNQQAIKDIGTGKLGRFLIFENQKQR